ncbi:helix-turn-helix transcriptional regulator [Elioraea sp. Yellowstone]|jgi:transcriptional regulator with XRE-family HTH domain|uniref:helix-turn-helix domain-containing protein n=1 Tax=Elioraea sp. Yellowstone TaxID=2592070 RepID=UPI001151F3C5|nr:helix-turn-helix transcriptional regulator [Elioraea sp. Yellowstone]TQF78869.1 helix-turn-helix transcriptional regulator [Elioraea sp. Yellowstone]
MRFTEIGQQLRQYRLESGLRAEEIAARLGVSRAALYRYEKGEVIKLDTIKRLAELLKISPLSLLGIGVEYVSRATLYFDRIRAIEEATDQILHVAGPVPYLVTSDAFDAALADVLADAAEVAGPERPALRAQSDQLLGILQSRKKIYQARRPSIIAIVTVAALQRFLEGGVGAGVAVSDRVRAQARAVAAAEVENIAALMEAEPIGVQLGLMQGGEPNGAFRILRSRERAYLAINPFRLEAHPAAQTGVAMITGADEALATHQKVAEALWREALKGAAAAARVRELVRAARVAA